MARDVAAPINHVHSDLSGKNAAAAATVPPVSGVDYGVPVYANLGSAVVPVSPSNVGVALQTYGQVTVTSSATQIKSANAARAALLVTNTGTVSIWLGDVSVTTSNGYELKAGCSVGMPTVSAVYGIVASTSQVAGFLEFQ